MSGVEVEEGLWQFTARHPEWTEEDSGEDGWDPEVAWWAAAGVDGVVLIDPLIEDWDELTILLAAHGGCAGIVRTCHWHQRSIPEAAARLRIDVWAGRFADGTVRAPCDRVLADGGQGPGAVRAQAIERHDEIALWLEDSRSLVFGDAMVRDDEGTLRVCPESWTQPPAGRGRLLDHLRGLERFDPRHVLVSHGPLVAGDAARALSRALG